ncbi:unnamed protein product [Protopolystoma xenopodis]|uniref:Uncharacterized protein n=1 Tax=Protopolystoma xenopodis TaxID=117903 RepID=A0A3S5BN87_9PLAT|nr:unnamed protein product [Protopolystoma xenopodis]
MVPMAAKRDGNQLHFDTRHQVSNPVPTALQFGSKQSQQVSLNEMHWHHETLYWFHFFETQLQQLLSLYPIYTFLQFFQQ